MPSPTTGAIGLVPQAFELLQQLICARFGLVYTIETAYLIERRLQQRLEAHGLTSFLDYYHLLTDPAQPESRRERELQEIFELLSTRGADMRACSASGGNAKSYTQSTLAAISIWRR